MRAFSGFIIGCLLLAGCSQKSEDAAAEIRDEPFNANAPPAVPAPGISVTAAPGVAFTYSYAFVLPDNAISAVQEQHASACEKLGPARCRITGMRYTLLDEDKVRGALQFKLDPALARAFGKEGIAAVVKAEGKLVDASIEGRDIGSEQAASQRRSTGIREDLAEIERQLNTSKLSDEERTELRAQADRLRRQLTGERETRSDGDEALANTPMTFTYSGDTGFTLGDDAWGNALDSAKTSWTTMISILLWVFATLLPWAVLVGLLALIWRSALSRRLRGKGADAVDTVETSES